MMRYEYGESPKFPKKGLLQAVTTDGIFLILQRARSFDSTCRRRRINKICNKNLLHPHADSGETA